MVYWYFQFGPRSVKSLSLVSSVSLRKTKRPRMRHAYMLRSDEGGKFIEGFNSSELMMSMPVQGVTKAEDLGTPASVLRGRCSLPCCTRRSIDQ
jgi:hypothetical protein